MNGKGNKKKKINSLLIALLFIFSFSIVSPNVAQADERQPVGILGYVTYSDGSPVNDTFVTVGNLDTDEYDNTTTDDDGLFSASLYAYDGERLRANCTVNDTSGQTTKAADLDKTTQWLNITLGGEPPNCYFTYNPREPCDGETVSFSDSSTDPDGSIVFWRWDFGDGGNGVGKHETHVYTTPGDYYVSLTVTDDDGLSSTKRKEINVVDCGEEEEDNVSDGDDEEIVVPPPQPPVYPDNPYTVPEMYHMLNVDKIGLGGEVKVAVIDTGVVHREYRGVDLVDIDSLTAGAISDMGVSGRDNHGHGTWCNYAAYYGVNNFTRGSQMSIKVIDTGICGTPTLLDALEKAKRRDVDVVSISLGSKTGSVDGPLSRKVEELRDNGIIVVCAAGNSGPLSSSINTPALSGGGLAVGSVDPMRTLDILKDDVVSEWSSRGPVTGLKELKPDCVAGGESIIGPYGSEEKVLSGTSMSTPIIAGGTAVVYSQHPTLYNTLDFFWSPLVPHIFEDGLEKSCYDKGEPNAYGHGIPDFQEMNDYCYHTALFYLFLILLGIAIIVSVVIYILYRYFGGGKKAGKKQ